MLGMQEGCIMLFTYYSFLFLFCRNEKAGAPNENIVQNHLNIALLNVF